jgi:hypothetical protein
MRAVLIATLAALAVASMPQSVSAQSISASERDALVRLRVERGGRAEDVDPLVRLANDAGAKGLPTKPLVSKIREGISKRHEPAQIEAVVRQMTAHLETATGFFRESARNAERDAAVMDLADVLGRGVTADEVGTLQREGQGSGTPVSPDSLAGAAEGLWSIKEAKLPTDEGTAVMVEALRQGYRPNDMVDLGREIKRRERDYREGRASLTALRDAIARGTRRDRLFTDSRRAVERPAATRPDPTGTTRDRPQPPERPTRPERPGGNRVR